MSFLCRIRSALVTVPSPLNRTVRPASEAAGAAGYATTTLGNTSTRISLMKTVVAAPFHVRCHWFAALGGLRQFGMTTQAACIRSAAVTWNGAAAASASVPPMSSVSPVWMNPTNGIIARMKHTFKTNKSIAKRFRVKGNGDLKRSKSGFQHNTGYRSRRSINKLGQSAPIQNPKVERKMKTCLGLR